MTAAADLVPVLLIHYTRCTDQSGTERYGCEIIAEQVDFLAKAKEAKPAEESQELALA